MFVPFLGGWCFLGSRVVLLQLLLFHAIGLIFFLPHFLTFWAFSSPLFIQLLGYHARRDALLHQVRGSKYEIQKSRLADDLCTFLLAHSALPAPFATASSPDAATPDDIGKFLFFRDSRGRTQIHIPSCDFLGLSGLKDCGCPVGLAAGTIDSMVGKLRAYFNSRGQTSPFSPGDKKSNPCDSTFVRDWVKSAFKEQRVARVTPHQAPPIFSTHLRLLVAEISRQLLALPVSAPFFPMRFCFLRDRCFFLVQWFAGDRAGDLGHAVGKEVSRHSSGALIFKHTIGKTIRQSGSQILIVPQIPEDPLVCPVAAFDEYVGACLASGLDLKKGYLFPPLSLPLRNGIKNVPFTSANATKRIRSYLSNDILPDVSAHGARAGCAATLLLLGASNEEVMDHCRWASERVFRGYHQIQKVSRVQGSALRLRDGILAEGEDSADAAAAFYDSLNSGSHQSPAF